MTILDESSGNQDERSPLKKDATTSSADLATAPPPYSSLPTTPSPNPIPSSRRAIPQTTQAIPRSIPQTVPQSHHVVLHHRPSPIRRFFTAFLVAWLVIFLWSVLLHSFNKDSGHSRHGYEYEVDSSRRWHPQNGIDNTGRVLPIQYPPIQLHQRTG